MNFFVMDPEWRWWIILYFFLGGIAAGAYFAATLIDLVGDEEDRKLSRVGYWIAFPLVLLCAVFLIADLTSPERFWHMVLKSEVAHEALAQGWPSSGQSWSTMSHALVLKPWSPMSIGALALAIFGLVSFASLVGSLWPAGRVASNLRGGFLRRLFELAGCVVGFFIAAYTGALLTATNQPLWSDSVWIAALFLASAASTGIATMLLLARLRSGLSGEALARLESADRFALWLELLVFVIFLGSLGGLLVPILQTRNGQLLVAGTLVVGLLLPLVLHLPLLSRSWHTVVAPVLILLGGFILRYAILTTPAELLARGPESQAQSAGEAGYDFGTPGPVVLPELRPEDRRPVGGGPGADPGNKSGEIKPRSKLFDDRSP